MRAKASLLCQPPRETACGRHCFSLSLAVSWRILEGCANGEPIAPVEQKMIDARTDAWGDAAMRQPNGASYEFSENRLPPLRWVNTEFRRYPFVLSAAG